MKLVLIGIQGSGKSTQGNLLSEKFTIPYISTGNVFRALAKEDTETGRYIKEVMNAGYLIPDEKTIEIVHDYLSRPEYKDGYILDGFPRTTGQAEKFKNGIDVVIYLAVSDTEALKRISGRNDSSRQDETKEAILKRIESFHTFTKPVLDYYKEKHMLIEVDGEKQIQEIHEEILQKLTPWVK